MHDALLAAFDAAHNQDPKGKELAYCISVKKWVKQLISEPSTALMLAAHCQHFERWVISRDSYPMDKAGYLKWRRAVAVRQGERVKEIMQEHNCDADLTERVAQLVGKHVSRQEDADAQALEDAACLVFLEEQAEDFAPKYIDKMIGIIQKTWAKMSPEGQALALKLDLPDAVSELVHKALAT